MSDQHDEAVEGDLAEHERPVVGEDLVERLAREARAAEAVVEPADAARFSMRPPRAGPRAPVHGPGVARSSWRASARTGDAAGHGGQTRRRPTSRRPPAAGRRARVAAVGTPVPASRRTSCATPRAMGGNVTTNSATTAAPAAVAARSAPNTTRVRRQSRAREGARSRGRAHWRAPRRTGRERARRAATPTCTTRREPTIPRPAADGGPQRPRAAERGATGVTRGRSAARPPRRAARAATMCASSGGRRRRVGERVRRRRGPARP